MDEVRQTNYKRFSFLKKIKRFVKGYLLYLIEVTKNKKNIYCTENHPFWINNNKNRILAKDICGSKRIRLNCYVYSLQFDEEGSYYVEDAKVDSISPNHMYYYLSIDLYFNPNKYKKFIMTDEDDPRRNKPKLIKYTYPHCLKFLIKK